MRRGDWYWRLCVHGGEGDKGEGVDTYSSVHYPICVPVSSIFLNSEAIFRRPGEEEGLRQGADVAMWNRNRLESTHRFYGRTTFL